MHLLEEAHAAEEGQALMGWLTVLELVGALWQTPSLSRAAALLLA